MLDQNDLENYRRARRAPGSLAFPSVRASARHDGRRLHVAHDDKEKTPVAGRPRYLLSHKPPYTFHRIALLWSNRAGVWQNVVDLA
jgi:hypothetical protein